MIAGIFYGLSKREVYSVLENAHREKKRLEHIEHEAKRAIRREMVKERKRQRMEEINKGNF